MGFGVTVALTWVRVSSKVLIIPTILLCLPGSIALLYCDHAYDSGDSTVDERDTQLVWGPEPFEMLNA